MTVDDVAESTPNGNLKMRSAKHVDDHGEVSVFTDARAIGMLYKWTNYVLGWQERYFELEDGVLVYYKTKDEKQFGTRGSITVRCSVIAGNEIDMCRFEVATSGLIWYLKAENVQSKIEWMNALNSYSRDSGCGSASDRVSTASACSTSSVLRASATVGELKERVEKLESHLEQTSRQLERMRQYVDTASQSDGETTLIQESLTLRSTASAVIVDIAACIHIINQQISEGAVDSISEMKIDAPSLQNKDEPCSTSASSSDLNKIAEGVLSDDDQDWHDAVEAYSSDNVTVVQRPSESVAESSESTELAECSMTPRGILTLPKCHSVSAEIERITTDQLRYAKAGVEEKVWQLFSEEGEMRMYKREVEINGLVCDPLKATHTVKGVSAREFIHFFFEPQYKLTWDETVDDMSVVEKISEDTVVIHQVHKKVWPAAQRESLFWSHVRQVNSSKDPDACDLFMVCNHDCERPDVPLASDGNVRVGLTVAMLCETVINKGCSKPRAQLTRDDIHCRIIYAAQVHPGGWVPSSALRVVYKREYPKFLRGFTKYVVKSLKSKQLCI